MVKNPHNDRLPDLYIIGNGFDVSHGIKSKYTDFRDWLQKNGQEEIIETMDILFTDTDKCSFWSDIEHALGEYDEYRIAPWCMEDAWEEALAEDLIGNLADAMNDFRKAFCNWVDTIDCWSEAKMSLNISAKYLSFNYTNTLELVYGIPAEQILHIHGSRLTPRKEYIIGHGNMREFGEEGDDGDPIPQEAYNIIIDIMDGWRKKSEMIIKKHEKFFQNLCNCTVVCILGFSYSDIDMPYLNEVIKSVDRNCRWVLTYYSNKDHVRAEKFVKDFGIKNYILTQW